MKVATYEAVVENGQIRFLESVRLPERSRVYVVVPGIEGAARYHVPSPRLAHPERAADFAKEVVEEAPDAGV